MTPSWANGTGWGWTVAVAAMLVLGGSNWTMPLTRFLAQLVAAGLLVAAIAAGTLRPRPHGKLRLNMPDGLWLAIFALIALHLVPLPPAIWSQLPGRELAARSDSAVFGALLWRPVSLDPQATWRSFLMLLPPFAVYLAARWGDRARLQALLRGVVVAAAVAIAAGIAQQALPSAEWLRFYPRGDYPLPMGFFTNRNHQATFLLCAMPMAAAWWLLRQPASSQSGPSGWPLAAFAGLAAVCALITGSRSGAALLPIALAGTAAAWFAAKPRGAALPGQNSRAAHQFPGWAKLLAAAGAVLMFAGLFWVLGDTELARPLERGDVAGDQRFDYWPLVVSAAVQFWPLGSGVGTFLDGYEMFEPVNTLSPLYLNHAHNDFMEIALEAGVPGLVLALVGVCELSVLGWRAWRTSRGQDEKETRACHFAARLASVAILLPVLHSLVDYPLRTVAISCIAALAAAMIVLPQGGLNPAAKAGA